MLIKDERGGFTYKVNQKTKFIEDIKINREDIEIIKKFEGGYMSITFLIEYEPINKKAVLSFPKSLDISHLLMIYGQVFYYKTVKPPIVPDVYETNVFINKNRISSPSVPYLIQEYIEGRTLNNYTKKDLENLGRILKRVHQATLSDRSICFDIKKKDFEVKFIVRKRRDAAFRMFYILPIYERKMILPQTKEIFQFVERSYKKVSNLLNNKYSLIHNDYSPMNVIKSGNKYYITDPSLVSYLFPESDMIKMYRHFKLRRKEKLFSYFLKGYGYTKNINILKYIHLVFSLQTYWFFKTVQKSDFADEIYNVIVDDFKEVKSFVETL